MEGRSLFTRILVLVMVLCMLLGMYGCRNTQSTEETTTEPSGGDVVEETTDPETTEEETEPEETVYPGGTMKGHMNGMNGNKGIYFTMEPNDLPADPTWATELKPATFGTIVLYRDGESYNLGNTTTGMLIKYSDTEYYLKLEEWIIGKYFPIRNGDVLKIEGVFHNGTLNAGVEIPVNYILIEENMAFFSTEYPTGGNVNVVYGGNAERSPEGMNSNGIYFTMKNNGATYRTDWSVEYKPSDASAVQIIRNGKTYNVGNIEAGTIVKYSDTQYYLKMEKWIIKDMYPVRDGDIIVLGGKFVHSNSSTVLHIDKTYIAVVEGILKFSKEYPTDLSVDVVQGGTMQSHPKGKNGEEGFYFSLAENSLYVDENADMWGVEYAPASADVIQLIRGDKTYSIGNVDAGTLIKFGKTDYYFKTQQWMIKDYFPITDGDILVVGGRFINAGLGGVLEIEKTYISYSEGVLVFSKEMPDENTPAVEVIQAGTMSSHSKGKNGTEGFYFNLAENDLYLDETVDMWGVEYVPADAGVIKLIRDGKTYDIGNTLAGTVIKCGETEYYLKTQQWMIKEYFPITDGDILVIEGRFVNAGLGAIFEIEKTYISYAEGVLVFSEEMPKEDAPAVEVIQAGAMTSHAKGKEGTEGFYFTLAENDLYLDESADMWAVEYFPDNAGVIKLIRDGKTYDIGNTLAGTVIKSGETEYFFKTAQWMIKDYFPITDGDILVIEGRFVNAGLGAIFEIEKTYVSYAEGVLVFSEEMPEEDVPAIEVIQAGKMSSHAKGKNGTEGFYFSMAENDLYYDENADMWAVEYVPDNAGVIKLIRNGETYEIGNTLAGTVIKSGETEYYLKTQEWMIKDYFPITDGDILVIEGRFVNAGLGAIFEIEKTFVSYAEGVLVFSEEMPEEDAPAVEVIQAGTMSSHAKGKNGTEGFYFTLAENDLYLDENVDMWGVEYVPADAGVIKLIRGGETYEIGNTLAGTVIKCGETEYYLKTQQWMIPSYFPITDGDILVVEGRFVNAGLGAIFEIAKTYISYSGGVLIFSEEMPEEDSGVEAVTVTMGEHANGFTGTGVYFTDEVNDLPHNAWSIEYFPDSAGVIKLIRDGETYDIANTAAGTIVKYSDTEYYLKLETWMYPDYAPFGNGDQFVVEGKFINAGLAAIMNIDKTYIGIIEGQAVLSDELIEMPEIESTEPGSNIYQIGTLSSHPNGKNGTGGFYATAEASDAPYDDWNVRYKPMSADCVKYYKAADGTTSSVANTGGELLVKISETEYYFEGWALSGSFANLAAGDYYIIEGQFYNGAKDAYIEIAKTYVLFDGATLIFSADEPGAEPDVQETTEAPTEPETPADHGPLLTDNGAFGEGIYVNMAANDAPVNVEYNPVLAENYQVIRSNGTVENIGMPGRGTLVKYESNYFLKCLNNPWCIGSVEITTDDILIVQGQWACNNDATVILTIAKTYVYYDGSAWVCSTTEPGTEPDVQETTEAPTEPEDDTVYAGVMQTHSNGMSGNGIYFSMGANDAPGNDWSYEYTQTSADNIKIIRGGVTTSIGIVGRPLIVKYGETDYYLKLEGWTIGDYGLDKTAPITNDDVLIIEGNFARGDVTLNITKSYVYYDGAAWVCSATEPGAEPEVQETTVPEDGTVYAGVMKTHSEGMSNNGIKFVMDANAAPYDGWSIEYTQTSVDNIKIIRGGVTTSIGIVGRPLIVKYGEIDYYLKLEGWTIGDYGMDKTAPVTTDDVLIIEGNFAYGDVTLNITKSYVYYDGAAWVCSATEPGTEPDVQDTTEAPTEPEVETTTEPETPADHGPLLTDNGAFGEGIYVNMAANDAPVNVEYNPVLAENYQVIRSSGTVENIGMPGRGTLVKYESNYFLKCLNNPWCIGSVEITTDDILIVQGQWACNNDATIILSIAKTYVYYDGAAWVCSTTEPGTEPDVQETTVPEDDTVYAGVMQTHGNGMSGNGIYFSMGANDAPGNDWSYEYTQTSVDNIKIIRGGVTTSIGIVGRPLIVKYGETDYYLKLEGWTIGDYGLGKTAPITNDDVLIIEGNFARGDVTLNITKSYVYYDGAAWVCSATEPGAEPDVQETTEAPTEPEVEETTVPEADNVYNIGKLGSHASGGSATGFHATGLENDAPYDGWSVEYMPVSADCIKLTRGGETTSVGNVNAGTIVKFGAAEYYVKFDTWMNSSFPLQAGDEVTVEGKFYNAANDAYIVIEKTTVLYDGTNFLIGVIQAGSLSNHAEKTTGGDGVYATMAENGALSNSDWSVEYTPAAEANYRVIRGGVEQNIGIPGRGTLVKVSEDEYYLKISGWCLDFFTTTTDDVFIIEGQWKCNADATVVLNIETTYLYHDGSAWVFSTTKPEVETPTEAPTEAPTEPEVEETQPADDPSVIQAGAMASQSAGLTEDYLNFSMEKNDLPNNVAGKAIYKPVSADCIKLVRNGVTYDIADPAADTILKRTTSNYRLVLAGLAMGELGSLQDGDMLIVSGLFTGGKTTETTVYTFRIATTYISIANGAPSYSETDPRA